MPPRFEGSADVRNVVYVLVGQDETVMQELMPESQGDFKNYMRMNVEMFRRMLVGVLLRITNSYSPPPPSNYTISLFVPKVCDAILWKNRYRNSLRNTIIP